MKMMKNSEKENNLIKYTDTRGCGKTTFLTKNKDKKKQDILLFSYCCRSLEG